MGIKVTKAELHAAKNTICKDLIAPNLKVLFCGINPGLYTAVTGNHFAKPGNRFWRALYAGGFTPGLINPEDDSVLLSYRIGITSFVPRATATATELLREEFLQGKDILIEKVLYFKPQWLAILGIDAYRKAFTNATAVMGLQEETIGNTKIWILPNPSGLNAHYPPQALGNMFKDFHTVIG